MKGSFEERSESLDRMLRGRTPPSHVFVRDPPPSDQPIRRKGYGWCVYCGTREQAGVRCFRSRMRVVPGASPGAEHGTAPDVAAFVVDPRKVLRIERWAGEPRRTAVVTAHSIVLTYLTLPECLRLLYGNTDAVETIAFSRDTSDE